MENTQQLSLKMVLLALVVIIFVLWDLTLGSVSISLKDVFQALYEYDSTSSEHMTLRVFRFPRVMTALFAGSGLALSGLLMQTLFQNPLAGPYVLGVNAGASLMVALATMTGVSFFMNDIGTIGAALLGAFGAGMFILVCSLYVKSKVSLLLVGIMFGSFTGALVNVVQSYSTPDDLKKFLLWGFGSLQNIQFEQLGIVFALLLVGMVLTFLLVKPLNLLVLGDKNASFLGVNVKYVRFLIIFITALFTGTITAFCGPIAFVGLIVPNIIKLFFKTANHLYLMIGTALCGALLLVFCDVVMQLTQSYLLLPLNALTALMGAPIVVWIIIKRF